MREQDFLNNLGKLFEQWSLLPNEVIKNRSTSRQLEPSIFRQFVDDFHPALQKLRTSGAMANVWEAAGLKRNEVRVAGTLNWFFDHLADHGQQHNLCSAVLEHLELLVTSCADKEKFLNFPKPSHLLNENGRPRYKAIAEVCPLGEKGNRVDIEINGVNLLLFIEVKIDAGQGDEQISRYHDIAMQKAAGRSWGVVYLTPSGRLPEKEQRLINTIGLSWRNVATAFQKYARTLDANNFAYHCVRQYARFVINFN